MVVGFNHNVMYKGEIFHIQTEDSGINNPHIITLLYRGGTILASKKTDYADIIKIDNLETVVEDLMKEQHKEMLRNLKNGRFDERAFGSATSAPPVGDASGPAAPSPAPRPTVAPASEPPAPAPKTPAPPAPPATSAHDEPRSLQSLDEVILDYLVRGDG